MGIGQEITNALVRHGKKGYRAKPTLSLSDGTSHGQGWLAELNLQGKAPYYASEIDPAAISFAQHHYPNTIQLGDMSNIDISNLNDLPEVLVGGTPCVNFSSLGKRNGMTDLTTGRELLRLDDYLAAKSQGHRFTPSTLAFEFKRLYDDIVAAGGDPAFLFENVASMHPKWRDALTELLGVEPYEIGGAGLTNRKRLIWTNATSPIENSEIQGRVKSKQFIPDSPVDAEYIKDKSLKWQKNPDQIDLFSGKSPSESVFPVVDNYGGFRTGKTGVPTIGTTSKILIHTPEGLRKPTWNEMKQFFLILPFR